MREPPAWKAGDVIGGRYRFVAHLGKGGMATVWRAEHLALGSMVAVKVLARGIGDRPGAFARFEREARAAAALQTPHVVQILDHGVEGGWPYIVMELLVGETLAERLSRRGMSSYAEAARVLLHIARALGNAHRLGMVHRDLKPENVFLVRNDDEDFAKLLDFGIVKIAEETAFGGPPTSTNGGTILGTPLYMSPEQLRGKGVDHRTDVWALALVAFECLCGRTAFQGESLADVIVAITSAPMPVPSTVAPVPAGFDGWFARCANRDPSRRPDSAREAVELLTALLSASEGDTGPATRSTVTSHRAVDTEKDGVFRRSTLIERADVAAAMVRVTRAESGTEERAPVLPIEGRRAWRGAATAAGITIVVATVAGVWASRGTGPSVTSENDPLRASESRAATNDGDAGSSPSDPAPVDPSRSAPAASAPEASPAPAPMVNASAHVEIPRGSVAPTRGVAERPRPRATASAATATAPNPSSPTTPPREPPTNELAF